MNRTIEYYNINADDYFAITSEVDLRMLYKPFLDHIPIGSRIMDLGCGSGRDVKWFREHGYEAYGLDASEELIRIARNEYDVPVEIGSLENWITDEPFEGIWCCAALMHLSDEDINKFFDNLKINLKSEGILYMSVKEGIRSGTDMDGRYYTNFSEEKIKKLLMNHPELHLIDLWYSGDSLQRETFRWLNALIMKY